MKSFRQYLSEGKNDCKKIFQKYVFGIIQGKREKNTAPEDKIWDIVRAYIGDNKNSDDIQKAFIQLRDCRGSYPELVPDAKSLYRGIRVKPLVLFKWLSGKKVTGSGAWSSVPIKYVGSSKNKIESFTTSKTMAMDFAKGRKIALGSGKVSTRFVTPAEAKKMRKNILEWIELYDELKNSKNRTEQKDAKAYLKFIKEEYTVLFEDVFGVGESTIQIPIFYEITSPDKNCVMSEFLANKISKSILNSSESEVTRINDGTATDALMYFPTGFKEVFEMVKKLKTEIESQVPLKFKEIPV